MESVNTNQVRILYQTVSENMNEVGACVTYVVMRPLLDPDVEIAKILFIARHLFCSLKPNYVNYENITLF